MAIRCSNCGNENPDDYVYCDECGARLADGGAAAADTQGAGGATPVGAGSASGTAGATQPGFQPAEGLAATGAGTSLRCPSCGAENVAGAAFCDECGASLGGVATASPGQPGLGEGAAAGATLAGQDGLSSSSASDDELSRWSRPESGAETATTTAESGMASEAPVPATEETISSEADQPGALEAQEERAGGGSGTDYLQGAPPPLEARAGDGLGEPSSTMTATPETMTPGEVAGTMGGPVAMEGGLESPAVEAIAPSGTAPGVAEATAETGIGGATLGTSVSAAGQACRNCGAPLRADALFCTRCGTTVAQQEQPQVCSSCGFELAEGDLFCARCGTRVQAPAAAGQTAPSFTGIAAATPSSSVAAEAATPEATVSAADVGLAPPSALDGDGAAAGAPVSTTAGSSVSPVSIGRGRLEVAAGGQVVELPDKQEILIGREDPLSDPPIFPDVDLTPFGGEEGGVSRRHARIIRQGNDYLVEDLQSTNYTKLNGQRLAPRAPMLLVDGSRLDFGKVGMIFRRQ